MCLSVSTVQQAVPMLFTECTALQFIVGYVNTSSYLYRYFCSKVNIVFDLSFFKINCLSALACRALGAELVSILSMTEQSWLESYFDVWTGLNDLGLPGMFSWSNEHMVTFTYWAPGEPNSHDGFSEDCVEMLHQVGWMSERSQTGRWNDVSCTELNTYICKKPRLTLYSLQL
uniref:C-type lectin domain-containing protein n=1 Tax=Mastacembelus armatus TaxID=205130 RepID=A0A7N8XPC3_9TELE